MPMLNTHTQASKQASKHANSQPTSRPNKQLQQINSCQHKSTQINTKSHQLKSTLNKSTHVNTKQINSKLKQVKHRNQAIRLGCQEAMFPLSLVPKCSPSMVMTSSPTSYSWFRLILGARKQKVSWETPRRGGHGGGGGGTGGGTGGGRDGAVKHPKPWKSASRLPSRFYFEGGHQLLLLALRNVALVKLKEIATRFGGFQYMIGKWDLMEDSYEGASEGSGDRRPGEGH